MHNHIRALFCDYNQFLFSKLIFFTRFPNTKQFYWFDGFQNPKWKKKSIQRFGCCLHFQKFRRSRYISKTGCSNGCFFAIFDNVPKRKSDRSWSQSLDWSEFFHNTNHKENPCTFLYTLSFFGRKYDVRAKNNI